jgi:hypothetical protein
MVPLGLKTEKYCAGEDQQKFAGGWLDWVGEQQAEVCMCAVVLVIYMVCKSVRLS